MVSSSLAPCNNALHYWGWGCFYDITWPSWVQHWMNVCIWPEFLFTIHYPSNGSFLKSSFKISPLTIQIGNDILPFIYLFICQYLIPVMILNFQYQSFTIRSEISLQSFQTLCNVIFHSIPYPSRICHEMRHMLNFLIFK